LLYAYVGKSICIYTDSSTLAVYNFIEQSIVVDGGNTKNKSS